MGGAGSRRHLFSQRQEPLTWGLPRMTHALEVTQAEFVQNCGTPKYDAFRTERVVLGLGMLELG